MKHKHKHRDDSRATETHFNCMRVLERAESVDVIDFILAKLHSISEVNGLDIVLDLIFHTIPVMSDV